MGGLNPAFVSPNSRKLPFACGYVLAQGDTFASTVAPDGSQIIFNALAEGEWDGPALANDFAEGSGSSHPAIPSHLRRNFVTDSSSSQWLETLSSIMHFHSGSWATKGAGNVATSLGPDQGVDSWFTLMPSFFPDQYLSGVAWAAWRAPLRSGISLKLGWGEMTVSGVAVWRTTRCRIFDAYGNVAAYQFTLNPVWHRIEAILRYKIKPQQPPLAGLIAAERACFNWDSIVELAARNDYILPNGNPRFMGNYIFAADATLASMLELMCRVDRSFIRTENGKITMLGNDARSSIFLMSLNHLKEGTSVNLSKKDISKAPNVFVPSYREIGIPAVAQVATVTQSSPGSPLTFTLNTPEPFTPFSVFTYGGSSDPSYDGDYNVGNYTETTSSPPKVMPGQFTGTLASPLTGGLVGSNDARFAQYAPATVQHRSAQRMTPAQAPGLSPQPSLRQVVYDCGNSTYDQTNRLMKFERDSTLGTDGDGWTAPITGSLTAELESIDANGKALLECREHDVITLDDWLFPEGPGDYEILEMEIMMPAGDDLGAISMQLRQYNPSAPTDVSDPPGDSYATVPDALPLSGFSPLVNPAWTLQGTPIATVAGDSTLTITVADLLVQVAGISTPTPYPTASWTSITSGTQVWLYVEDSTGIGSSPTFHTQTGAPISAPTAGQMLVFSGSFAMPSGGGSGPAAAIYSPNWPTLV